MGSVPPAPFQPPSARPSLAWKGLFEALQAPGPVQMVEAWAQTWRGCVYPLSDHNQNLLCGRSPLKRTFSSEAACGSWRGFDLSQYGCYDCSVKRLRPDCTPTTLSSCLRAGKRSSRDWNAGLPAPEPVLSDTLLECSTRQ